MASAPPSSEKGPVRASDSVGRRTVILNLLLAVVSALAAVGAIEVVGRAFLWRRAAYDVLFLQPHRELGWTQVPNLEWTWAGMHWYANDFSVRIRTNSRGFRDAEHAVAKPGGVIRIALLGDSLIEAVQVPFEKTAGQLLEAKLNAQAETGRRYEVLNFGISSYGIGQYLLLWEHEAHRFDADYVFVLVAPFHLTRTVNPEVEGRFLHTRGRALRIRPTFRLEQGALVREPAAEFDEFVRVQEEAIRNEFGGGRMRRRETSVIGYYLKALAPVPPARTGGDRVAPPRPPVVRRETLPHELLPVNLAILEELGRQVRASGAEMVMVDLIGPYEAKNGLPQAVDRFRSREGFGNVPLAKYISAARYKGIPTHWAHDLHFNEAGNEVVAQSLFDWLAQRRAGTVTAR